MGKGSLKIHSQNILPIIKKWLYSEKDIFVRELVSNGCDAIFKLRKLTDATDTSWRIDLTIDKENKTLTFSDNGIGMDHEEVETYIAQIAFSGAEEFVKKYESHKEEDQIIGHFGLGFYSSYMAAELVEIDTLSYKEGTEPVFWSCDGSSSYTIDKGERKERGTTITLHLAKGEEAYLDETKMRQILLHYCAFLPYPIYLNGKQINETPPLWTKATSECSDKEYLDFYRHLFPMEPEPLFWIHLNVDFPFHLKGILYFPKISKESELKKESIKLFCNRVFVSDNCKDLLPEYLTILRGAIDSPDIPLNVSRSYLQMDNTVRQLGSHISKKISDRLSALYRTDRERFISYWEDLELIIKFGALQDDKFYERVQEFLIWKTADDSWTTIEELGKETLYYTSEEGPTLELFREKQIPVLFVRQTMIDQAILQMLERKTSIKFKRIDSHLDESLIDSSREKTLLNADGRSEAATIAAFFKKKLGVENLEVEAKSLSSDAIPALLTMKEEERRLRDSLAMHNPETAQSFPVKRTFVVNTNNRLISSIQRLESKDPALATHVAKTLYDLARLSHREMEPKELSTFISKSTTTLEHLLNTLTET